MVTKIKNKEKNKKMSRIVGLPRTYPRVAGDTMVVPFKLTVVVNILSGVSTNAGLIVLGSGASTTGYTFLNTICAPFAGLYNITTRWMITGLKVQARATGVGGTANTFVAVSYIPSNTGIDNPPSGLSEVSQAHHYCESSLGTIGNLQLNPANYFNDWRQCTDNADASDSQCGLLQYYGSGSSSIDGQTAGVITISGVLHMAGQRI
nr:hypothetical protein [Tolivirales sp.]